MSQTPSIGRIVHYTPETGSKTVPAIITDTDQLEDGTAIVKLTIFHPNGTTEARQCKLADEPEERHAHWPKFVPPPAPPTVESLASATTTPDDEGADTATETPAAKGKRGKKADA